MPQRVSVVRNVSWESEDTRGLSKSQKDDFRGKCELIYPAFINFLKLKRKEDDQSHDVIRRKLYDVLHFRHTDADIFIDRVLNAVAARAYDEKVVSGYTSKDIYYKIIIVAHKESVAAKKI